MMVRYENKIGNLIRKNLCINNVEINRVIVGLFIFGEKVNELFELMSHNGEDR